MKNIELKMKIDNINSINDLLKNKSFFQDSFFQKDTYYLLGKNRLKTREEEKKIEIIYYRREDREFSKDSKYFVFECDKYFFSIIKNLLQIFFGKKKIVEKERSLYLYKNTRIHLDKVKYLGDFLELETVVKDEQKYNEYLKEHHEVIEKFNLNKYEKIAYSYSDLI